MKTLKLTKLIARSLIVASVLTLNPIGASAEWKKDNDGWSNWWWYAEGDSYATGWREIDGNWYYFYPNDDKYKNVKGYMAIGYIGDYYLNRKGVWTHLDYSDDNSKFNEFVKRLNEIEKNDREDPRKVRSTSEIVDYSYLFNQKYNVLLDDIYNYLKEVMTEKEFEKFQNEQTEWINEKETEIENSREPFKGGSISCYIGGLTALTYTHDRIYELLKYVNNLIDKSNLSSSEIRTNEITESEARQLIMEADGEYIRDKWSENDYYLQLVSDITSDKETFTAWNLPREPYYQFYVVQDVVVGGYLVGKNSKNVYSTGNQGYMAAYQVKDNKIIKTFKFVWYGESYEWR